MSYPPVPASNKIPQPIGTPSVGEVPQVSQVSPLELEWVDASGTGTVTSVTATDTSIVVSGTDTVAPTIATGTLDVIATEHPPAANWSNNSKKITSLANGASGQDAAAFGQIPTSASAIGGLLAANNLSDLASKATALSGLVAADGLPPVNAGFTSFATGGSANLINSSSGSSSIPVAGSTYYAAGWVPYTVTLTGLILVTGSVGGTDEWIGYLWNGAGAPIASSSLSGIAAPAATTKKAFPFVTPVTFVGPAVFFAGLQSNGTTAKFLTFPNAVEGFATGTIAGVFGTPPSFPSTTSYNVNNGPFISTY